MTSMSKFFPENHYIELLLFHLVQFQKVDIIPGLLFLLRS